ncbi:unnamed protein product [Microthlaspi erraticum]|uniref:Jacalin-type lectin domain-containing protein n=1 Tax=Microthlaspi erraticum TaxID=1685480 RepID=A0A6D2JJE6_9BRAS|nr:unnamed protein product [Microthlaspi erraticum]
MTQRLDAAGSNNAKTKYVWDDGSDHDDVTKIYVRGGLEGIQFIMFDYVKSGQPKRSFHGYSKTGFTQMFEINHLQNEHLESVEGYYTGYPKGIQGLQFKTNLRISEMMGYAVDEKFTLAVDGKKITGFHGSAEYGLDALGAYFTEFLPTRLEPKGGKKGTEWDDGPDHEDVTKVHVRAGVKGIQNIKFDYVDKDDHMKEGPVHGSISAGGFNLEPFEINHLDKEYLLSLDGYYDETSGVIQTLQFKTNMKTSEVMGYEEKGTKFSLGCNGMKIIGFHGHAKKNLNSLGAYLTSLPLTKLEYKGNNVGTHWDDGTWQGVRKVYVYYDAFIRCLSFDYDNEGKVETRHHGSMVEVVGEEAEFLLEPNEFVTSIKGKFKNCGRGETWFTSLTFKTSTGRTSPTFGNVFGDNLVDFVLESKGCALVGFYGWCSYGAVHALGAYSHPMPSLQDAEKLEPQSGDEGASSDNDG